MDKMNTKQRKEWLASLKTGDLVTLEGGPHAGTIYKVIRNERGNLEVLLRELSVTGILPKGTHDPRARWAGALGTCGKVVPPTEEQIVAHKARIARSHLSWPQTWRQDSVTDEQVLAIARILNFDPLG